MPIIWAPPLNETSDNEVAAIETMSALRQEHFRRFLSAKSWKCPDCQLTNHGWNEKCADWRCRTARPE